MTPDDPQHAALRAALDEGDLTPVFQPIVNVGGDCLGFEALTRFPNGCPPDAVWALAQALGVAVALDTVALTMAVRGAQSLPGTLFLNVSAAHLSNPTTLEQFGLPDHLVWEVTESGIMTAAGFRGTRWLKDHGYRVAMDDAGAGYSTEDRLKQLRPDIVKLDICVVQRWGKGEGGPLRRWVAAARRIGAVVLAEGVEDPSWRVALAQEGVHAFQGYAFGKPAPAAVWLTQLPISGG